MIRGWLISHQLSEKQANICISVVSMSSPYFSRFVFPNIGTHHTQCFVQAFDYKVSSFFNFRVGGEAAEAEAG